MINVQVKGIWAISYNTNDHRNLCGICPTLSLFDGEWNGCMPVGHWCHGLHTYILPNSFSKFIQWTIYHKFNRPAIVSQTKNLCINPIPCINTWDTKDLNFHNKSYSPLLYLGRSYSCAIFDESLLSGFSGSNDSPRNVQEQQCRVNYGSIYREFY